jgi:transposase-like protein
MAGQKFASGTLAIATASSKNSKLGDAATTYAAQTSCPTGCPFFDGGGCYAEAGSIGKFLTAPLNAAAKARAHTAVDVARVVSGRVLRLHTVGDCASDEAARIVAAAAERYQARGGGAVWTYTHAWRQVLRGSWGQVSVLASCETAADVREARARGYATALVVEEFSREQRHQLGPDAGNAAGADILPCPQQTSKRTCTDCRLCFDDKKLHQFTVRQATKTLLTPEDPDRRLTTRELIPRVIAELEAEGTTVTNSVIAKRLNCNPSSVAEMRGKLEEESQRRDETAGKPTASRAASPVDLQSIRSERRHSHQSTRSVTAAIAASSSTRARRIRVAGARSRSPAMASRPRR